MFRRNAGLVVLIILLSLTPALRAQPVPHDSNDDGRVDIADFMDLQIHFGAAVDPNMIEMVAHDFDLDDASDNTLDHNDFGGFDEEIDLDPNDGCGGDEGDDDEDEYPPAEDDDDWDDDDDDCGGEGDEGGPETVGPGMHLTATIGQVWTKQPIVSARSSGMSDLSFSIRYDSRRAHIDSGIGHGWTHSYGGQDGVRLIIDRTTFRLSRDGNEHPQFAAHCAQGRITYVGRSGRRTEFRQGPEQADQIPPFLDWEWDDCDAQTWSLPAGRDLTLAAIVHDREHDETGSFQGRIRHSNGVTEVFETVDGPGDKVAKLVEVIDRRGRITRMEYDGEQLVAIISPHGRVITLEYADFDGTDRLWKVTGPDGVTEFDYENGDLVSITDPENNTITYDYDASHRLTSETLKNGVTYTVEYTPYSRTIKAHPAVGGPETIAHVQSEFLLPARADFPISPGFVFYTDGRQHTWRIQRDSAGRPIKWDMLDPTAGPVQQFTREYGTGGNSAGRIINTRDERNELEHTTWTAGGRVATFTDKANNLHEFEYDEFGLMTRREVDGRDWQYERDPANGDLLEIIDPHHAGDPNDTTSTFVYTNYDPNEALPMGITDPLPGRIKNVLQTDRNGNQTFMEYDGKGNLIKVTRGYGVLNLVTEFEYDGSGRMTKRIERRGTGDIAETTWNYDDAGRLESIVRGSAGSTTPLNLTTTFVRDGHGNVETVTNPRGKITEFEYDHRNRRAKRTVDKTGGGLNLETEWNYDGNGNVTKVTDPDDHETDFTYDLRDRLRRIDDAAGFFTEIEVDAAGRITRVNRNLDAADPNAVVSVSMTYDDLDRLLSQTLNPEGSPSDPNDTALTTQWKYESVGCACPDATAGKNLPSRMILPSGLTTRYEYDELDRRTKAIVKLGDPNQPAGVNDLVTSYDYDAGSRLIKVTRPAGEEVTYAYDEANRVEQMEVGDSLGLITAFTYDGSNNVRTTTTPTGNVLSMTYDAANRLKLVTDNALGTSTTVVDLSYDNNGNVTGRSTAITDQDWTFSYDGADRRTSATDPYEQAMLYAYDGRGNLTDYTDRKGIVTHYDYDELGRITAMIENYGADPNDPTAGTATTYTYNGAWQTGIADHDSNETTYDYDNLGRLRKITFPGGGELKFDFDTSGRLSKRTRQGGIVTNYAYDDFDRLYQRTYPGGDPTETFLYDKSSRLTTATRAGVAERRYDYDDAGRTIEEVQEHLGADPDEFTIGYEYEMLGATTGGATRTVTYPGGRIVTETLDKRGRLEDIDGDTGGALDVGAAYSYDAGNRRTQGDLANGVRSTWDFDLNNRLLSVQHEREVSSVWSDLMHYAYTYDPEGNPTSKEDKVTTDRSEVYQYDKLHRLIGFDRGEVDFDPNGVPSITTPIANDHLAASQTWNLDRRGNWSEFDETVGATPATTAQDRAANGVNEITSITINSGSPISLTSDARGNLTQDPTAYNKFDAGGSPSGRKYTYDAENRLTKVQRAADNAVLEEYVYDALGGRIETKTPPQTPVGSGGTIYYPNIPDGLDPNEICATGVLTVRTRHVLAGLEAVEEHERCESTSWNLAREFIWGGRFPEPVALIDHTARGASAGGTEEVLHYLHDRLGSVIGLTSVSGALAERYTYDPYGKTLIERPSGGGWARIEQSRFGNPFAWTGQRYDPAARLYHFRYRSYDPKLGRWLQRDPLGYSDSPNLYLYALAAPLYWIDLFGLEGVPWWVSATDTLFPPSYGAERQFVDNVCTACDYAQLPADIATAGAGSVVRAGIKKAGKEAAEAAAEALGKAAAEAAAKNAAEGAAKRVPAKKLRREWEKENKKSWPKDEDGRNYDAHHKKPRADGGDDTPSNIEPKQHDEHMEHHKKCGDFKRWGERGSKGKKDGDLPFVDPPMPPAPDPWDWPTWPGPWTGGPFPY